MSHSVAVTSPVRRAAPAVAQAVARVKRPDLELPWRTPSTGMGKHCGAPQAGLENTGTAVHPSKPLPTKPQTRVASWGKRGMLHGPTLLRRPERDSLCRRASKGSSEMPQQPATAAGLCRPLRSCQSSTRCRNAGDCLWQPGCHWLLTQVWDLVKTPK